MNKFIVFDLDGTLINTVTGITVAVNNTLAHFGYKYHYTSDEVVTFLGHGARYLYSCATKKEKISDEEYSYFEIEYVKTQGISEVYPEVIDSLNKMTIMGVSLLIYSNKPNGALQYLIRDKMPTIKFSAVQGNVSEYPTKPDATLLNKILDELHLNPNDGFYVGDSNVDIETARNAKLKAVILNYGYGNKEKIKEAKPDFVFEKFSDLFKLI
jgi:phosphoglycolate phosphatase